eukprot:1658144-Rhodomonas_salina.1
MVLPVRAVRSAGHNRAARPSEQVTQQGAVSVTNCMIETADFGISIDNEGSGRIVGNKFSGAATKASARPNGSSRT